MKLQVALLAAGLVCTGAAFAQNKGVDPKAAEALAQKSGCIACHNVDKKVIGPAYKDVAAKYKTDKDAEKKLVEKVKKGGAGVWGQIPMPPNAQVSDADIKTLVSWVLSLK
jgi:cytochrome c